MQQQPENDPTRNLGLGFVMKSCKDIQYLSTMGTNNLIIRI